MKELTRDSRKKLALALELLMQVMTDTNMPKMEGSFGLEDASYKVTIERQSGKKEGIEYQ